MQIKTDTHGLIMNGLRAAASKATKCNRRWIPYGVCYSWITHTVHVVTENDDEYDPDWLVVATAQKCPATQQEIADAVYQRVCEEMKKFA